MEAKEPGGYLRIYMFILDREGQREPAFPEGCDLHRIWFGICIYAFACLSCVCEYECFYSETEKNRSILNENLKPTSSRNCRPDTGKKRCETDMLHIHIRITRDLKQEEAALKAI